MNNIELIIRLSQVDSWFFRDARPHDAAGASRLSSQFPPPLATLAGAVRTRLGDSLGVDWQQFARGEALVSLGDEQIDLCTLIGQGDDTGNLTFGPPALLFNNAPLYPVPAYLLDAADQGMVRLVPGKGVCCDLSQRAPNGELAEVRLPEFPAGIVNAKPLDYCWTDGDAMGQLLRGVSIRRDQVLDRAQLFVLEPRLGIARNNQTRSVQDGLLYQTEHLRLLPEVELAFSLKLPAVAADALRRSIQDNPIQRLGGEGRMAAMQIDDSLDLALPQISPTNGAQGIVLTLLSAADVPGVGAEQPLPGFTSYINPETYEQGWRGRLADIDLELVTAVTGKIVRLGGWDLNQRAPKDVVSLLPAGSSWFMRPLGGVTLSDVITRLHGANLGQRTELGYGRLACGLWQ
ncbi:type III-B CRISPR module-associated Cmr3 family protein [Marinobacterium stanieri]|uniref:type III-B CRISPR module-associated Cmr3 family protein n=1 Tax=Marinobacterium stanieri TaxID=49186 RepID=UPI003A8D7B3C